MTECAAGVARLAVEHAREPLDEKVDSGLQRVAREDAATPPPTRWTPGMVIGAVAARVRELRASADDNIEEIQQAKTDHARIQHEAYTE